MSALDSVSSVAAAYSFRKLKNLTPEVWAGTEGNTHAPTGWGQFGGQTTTYTLLAAETVAGTSTKPVRMAQVSSGYEGIKKDRAYGPGTYKVSLYARRLSGSAANDVAFSPDEGSSAIVLATAAQINAQSVGAWVKYSVTQEFASGIASVALFTPSQTVGRGWDIALPLVEIMTAIRVRRSSDDAEQEIGFDGSGNFDDAAFSTFIGSGKGYAKIIHDQSGNSVDLTQSTKAAQAEIRLNACGGEPTLWFTGAQFSTGTLASSPTALTAECVGYAQLGGSFFERNSGGNSERISMESPGRWVADRGYNNANTYSRIDFDLGPFRMLSAYYGASLTRLVVDGVAGPDSTTSHALAAGTSLTVGDVGEAFLKLNGAISELILIYADHSAGSDSALVANIVDYWSLEQSTRDLPASIPDTIFGLGINLPAVTPWPALGQKIMRVWDTTGCQWAEINTANGTYSWAALDALLANAVAHGQKVLYTLARTPQWASARPNETSSYGNGQAAEPSSMTYLSTFLTALFARPHASVITHLEIWNEPGVSGVYTGTIAKLVEIAQTVFNTCNSVAPSVTVISPSYISDIDGLKYEMEFLQAGGGAYCDSIGFHGYATPGGGDHRELITAAILLQNQMLLGAKGLFCTETSFNDSGIPEDSDRVAYITQTFLQHALMGVDGCVWYHYDNALYGTLYADGAVTATGRAYQKLAGWLTGADIAEEPENTGTQWSWRLRQGGRPIEIAWDSAEASRLTDTRPFTRKESIWGVSSAVRGDVQLSHVPLLLETDQGAAFFPELHADLRGSQPNIGT